MKKVGLTQRVQVLTDRGETRDQLDQAWFPVLQAAGLVGVPVPNSLTDPVDFVRALALDGLILTGGNDLLGLPGATDVAPERDRTEAALLDHAAGVGLPVLGVCRGLQMLVRHHGGQLRPVEGHVRAPHPIRVPPSARPRMPEVERPEVNSFHGWGLLPSDLPPCLRAVGLAPDGTVEALEHDDLLQWAIMWHPERAPRTDADQRLLRSLFLEAPR